MELIKRLEKQLQASLLERDEVIRGLILGLLTGKHVLILGPPGTGKSMLVNRLAERLEAGKNFSYLMTQFTRPEEIIGPVSLKYLEDDEFKRVLTGKIADAHFVFLDEIFNANSGCANTILTIMNEGIYFNGREVVKVPLITMVGAANQLPAEASESLAAFYDRFLLRYQVDYIKDEHNLARLLADDNQSTNATFTVANIMEWQSQVHCITVPPWVDKKLISLVAKLRKSSLPISDRRVKESRQVLKANAFLAGRHQVTEEDFGVLQHIFWHKPEEKSIIQELIFNFATPYEKRAAKLVAEARQIKLRIDSADSRGRRMALGSEVNIRLMEITEELKEIGYLWSDDLAHELIRTALYEVEDIHHHIIKSCLGVAPGLDRG